MQYRIRVIVHSDAFHQPVRFMVEAPEALARKLMATPVKSVTIGVEATGGVILDKTPLLDFK